MALSFNPYSSGMKIERCVVGCYKHVLGLNPCFIGMKIELLQRGRNRAPSDCLNPYSNGMKIEPNKLLTQKIKAS